MSEQNVSAEQVALTAEHWMAVVKASEHVEDGPLLINQITTDYIQMRTALTEARMERDLALKLKDSCYVATERRLKASGLEQLRLEAELATLRESSRLAGDDTKRLPDWLLGSAEALLKLDRDGVLVPHGIGGHAGRIISEFLKFHGVDVDAAMAKGDG